MPDHAIKIAENIGAAITKYDIALPGKRHAAYPIISAAVDFHRDIFLPADEADDITADLALPDELEAAKPSRAQREPQLHLRICGIS